MAEMPKEVAITYHTSSTAEIKDYFAAWALMGIITRGIEGDYSALSRMAYDIADKMMDERNRRTIGESK